jgi:hypothetical protein
MRRSSTHMRLLSTEGGESRAHRVVAQPPGVFGGARRTLPQTNYCPNTSRVADYAASSGETPVFTQSSREGSEAAGAVDREMSWPDHSVGRCRQCRHALTLSIQTEAYKYDTTLCHLCNVIALRSDSPVPYDSPQGRIEDPDDAPLDYFDPFEIESDFIISQYSQSVQQHSST